MLAQGQWIVNLFCKLLNVTCYIYIHIHYILQQVNTVGNNFYFRQYVSMIFQIFAGDIHLLCMCRVYPNTTVTKCPHTNIYYIHTTIIHLVLLTQYRVTLNFATFHEYLYWNLNFPSVLYLPLNLCFFTTYICMYIVCSSRTLPHNNIS